MSTFLVRQHPLRPVLGVVLSICLGHFSLAAADAAASDQSGVPDGLPEVTVIGKMNHRALSHAVSQFVQSHAKPTATIGQIGRWNEPVCPAVFGLKDAYAQIVSERIKKLALSVGAPVRKGHGPCTPNVQVIFTPEPQAMLDHIAIQYRSLLGSYPATEAAQVKRFSHPIQGWYLTGSRSLGGWQPPVCFTGCAAPVPNLSGDALTPFLTNLTIDVPGSAGATGSAGSYLSHGLRSEFVHVLIIIDAGAVAHYSLQTISDYTALLALTHVTTQDTCTTLPSVLNLFVADCATPPAAITASDTAYLKALYGANLDKNLNIEQGDIRDHMLEVISDGQ